MPASDLKYFGHAGGSGLDSQPLQAMPRLFIQNMMAAAKWVYPNTTPVIRCDLLSTYDRASDTITGWSFSSVDVVVDEAEAAGCRVLIDCHPKNYSANSGDVLQFPMIQPGSGKMDGQMAGMTSVCNHYAAQIASGVVLGIELYNEPNSIGSIQGHLDGPGADYSTGVLNAGTAGFITMNGRNVPYYELIGRYVKDSAEAIRNWLDTHTHPSNFIVSGPCTGAIDLPLYRAILDWAYQKAISGGALVGRQEMSAGQKNADRGFFVEDPVGGPVGRRLLTHCSVHIYQNHDPLTDTGSVSKIRTVETLATHFRPLLIKYTGGSYTSGNSAISLGILVTEGINAGSNKWNRYQRFDDGTGLVEGKGKAALDANGGIINWLDLFGGSRQAANQTSGQLTQPGVQRNFYRKVRLMNANGLGCEMILPHVLIRETDITKTDATGGSPVGEQSWQDGRAYFQIAAGGTWSTSSTRFPVADVMRAEILSYQQGGSFPPSFSNTPRINDLTPVVGQTLSVTPATISGGSPAPTVTRVWRRDGVPISGATGLTYTTTAADRAHVLDVAETAANGVLPNAVAISAPTSPVTDPPLLVPVNQIPPTLSDTDGPLSTTNRPNPGKQITSNSDPTADWSPATTSQTVTWQRLAPDGVTIEDI